MSVGKMIVLALLSAVVILLVLWFSHWATCRCMLLGLQRRSKQLDKDILDWKSQYQMFRTMLHDADDSITAQQRQEKLDDLEALDETMRNRGRRRLADLREERDNIQLIKELYVPSRLFRW